MRNSLVWWGALLVAVTVAAACTVPRIVHSLGEPGWHHTASLVGSLAAFTLALYWAKADVRRHHAIGVAFWTTLALVSGFVLLYAKGGLKESGYKDWAKFWHVAWSWMALWYAIGHTWINRIGLGRALRRQVGRWGLAVAYAVPIVALAVAVPLSWSDAGGDALQEPQYIPLTLWTWLALVALPYAIWLASRWRQAAWMGRVSVQNFVGVWLVPITLAANLSGLPILYFGTKDTALKYVAKYWHTWPSIALAVLLFAHTIHFLPGLGAHAKRQST